VGFSSRLMHRTSVLFPAPDRPIMPNISPSSTDRLMLSRATTASSPSPKVLLRFSICMIGFFISCSFIRIISWYVKIGIKKSLMNFIKDDSVRFVVPPCFAHTSRYEPRRVRICIDTPALLRALPSQPVHNNAVGARLQGHLQQFSACPFPPAGVLCYASHCLLSFSLPLVVPIFFLSSL